MSTNLTTHSSSEILLSLYCGFGCISSDQVICHLNIIFPGLPPDYLENLRGLPDHAMLFLVWVNGEIQAGDLYLQDGKIMRLYKAASNRLQSSKQLAKIIAMGHRLMIWEAIKRAKESGFQEFDLGGLELNPKSDAFGVTQFKRRFGGELRPYYEYRKYYSRVYAGLSVARRSIGQWIESHG